MIRLLVTGVEGQLARSLAARAKHHDGIEVIPVGRPALDLEIPETIAPAMAAARPDIVVNAAAYTAVDKAENEPRRAFAINRDGAAAVADATARRGAALIQISTDYVYSGSKPGPYAESDETGPLGVYGQSKLEGEIAVRARHPAALILRTSWVYSPFGGNFVKTMLRLGGERDSINVVDDQTGNPTGALDLADAILRIAPVIAGGAPAGDLINACGTGSATWCGLARYIFEVSASLGGPRPAVIAIPTSAYPTAARRPANSQLDSSRFRMRYGFSLPPWQDGVAGTVRQILAGSGR